LATPDIRNCYQKGLQGLNNHSHKIILQDPNKCGGSVDIDVCTTTKYPNSNRWDYVFDYKGEAFFMEVHSANTSEVSVVLKKLQWLIDWLQQNAPEIYKLKPKNKTAFYWVQSKEYNILKNSPQERIMVQKGIRPVARITLN
jgi:hypothetical protein